MTHLSINTINRSQRKFYFSFLVIAAHFSVLMAKQSKKKKDTIKLTGVAERGILSLVGPDLVSFCKGKLREEEHPHEALLVI